MWNIASSQIQVLGLDEAQGGPNTMLGQEFCLLSSWSSTYNCSLAMAHRHAPYALAGGFRGRTDTPRWSWSPHDACVHAIVLAARGCARPDGVFHQVAARIQISSSMPGRRARGEGTNKVSVRQGRGYAGALPTALRAHRVPFTISSWWRIVRGGASSRPGGTPPTPCCRRGRLGG